MALNNLAGVLLSGGDLLGSRPLFERALAIDEKVLPAEHTDIALIRAGLGELLLKEGKPIDALVFAEAALAAHDKALTPHHPRTMMSAGLTATVLDRVGRAAEAAALRKRYGIEGDGEVT
jgi:Tetratricopeptide repeat